MAVSMARMSVSTLTSTPFGKCTALFLTGALGVGMLGFSLVLTARKIGEPVACPLGQIGRVVGPAEWDSPEAVTLVRRYLEWPSSGLGGRIPEPPSPSGPGKF